jgi:putative tryptophan/tyrosine transport system substrate-binding protein
VVTRRAFLGALAGGFFAAPLAAEAQSAGKVYRIGWLAISRPTSAPLQRPSESFLQGLRDHGFAEGQNVIIERRYSEGRPQRQRMPPSNKCAGSGRSGHGRTPRTL